MIIYRSPVVVLSMFQDTHVGEKIQAARFCCRRYSYMGAGDPLSHCIFFQAFLHHVKLGISKGTSKISDLNIQSPFPILHQAAAASGWCMKGFVSFWIQIYNLDRSSSSFV